MSNESESKGGGAVPDLIGALDCAWRGVVPHEERLLFMRWPSDKQRLALERLECVNAFQDGARAAVLYPKLGIGKARFYKLLKAWKEEQSLAALVPYATEESREKRTKLDPDVVALIEECLRESAQSREHVSEYELSKRIRERAIARSLPPPAQETLTRYIAKSAMNDAELSLAPVSRGFAHNPGDIFAAHLVIDHTTVDLVTVRDDAPLRPTLTMVLDDASRLILGAHLSADRPRALAVREALIDARERYDELCVQGVRAVEGLQPLLSARFSEGDDWLLLERALLKVGFNFWNVTRQPASNHKGYGRLIRRFMITKLGDISLLTNPTWMEPKARVTGDDTIRFTPIPWESAEEIVRQAIDQHNISRLAVAKNLSQTDPGELKSIRLGDDFVDYLAVALREFAA